MIIRKYLFRELGTALGGVLGVLLLIYVSNRLIRFLAEAAAGRIASDAILELLALKLAGHVVLLLPLAVYLGVILGLGRLHKDSEVVAMQTGGVGVRGLAQYTLMFAAALAAFTAALSFYVAPSIAALQEGARERAEHESAIAAIVPGRFRRFGSGERVLYVEDVDRESGVLGGVFVRLGGEEADEVLVSERGFQSMEGRSGDRFMVLEDGYRYRGVPGAADFVVTRFERHAVRLEEGAKRGFFLKSESYPTMELLAGDEPWMAAELQWRMSLPLSVLLLGLLAVPLARTSPREGRYGKLFTAVLVYFVYNNALGIARKLMETGDLPPWVGVWPVHAVLAVVVAAAIVAQTGRRLRLRLPGRWRRGAT